MKNGYGGNIILREMSKKLITTEILNDYQKCLIFLKLSSLDHLLNNGSDEELIIIKSLLEDLDNDIHEIEDNLDSYKTEK